MTATTATRKANRRSAARSAGPKTTGWQTKDDAVVEKWYRKAAEQGYSSAQNNLGEMRRRGRGVAK